MNEMMPQKCLGCSLRKVMKIKGVSFYHLENFMILLKCLGCYRVTIEKLLPEKYFFCTIFQNNFQKLEELRHLDTTEAHKAS